MTMDKKRSSKEVLTVVLMATSLFVCIATSGLSIGLSVRLSTVEELLNRALLDAQPQTQDNDERKISCQPCSLLTFEPFVEDDAELQSFMKVRIGDVLMCCSRTPGENGKLMRLFVRRKIAEDRARGQCKCNEVKEQSSTPTSPSGRQRAFAHLLAGRQNNTDRTGTTSGFLAPIKNWLETRKLTQARGVATANGHIEIQKPGLYMVYSHVQFSDTSPPPGGAETGFYQLTHKVCRHNLIYANGGEECLMEAEVTKHLNLTPTLTRNPSYMLGVFKLKENDKLYVLVTNTSLLSWVPESTFFGVLEMT